MPSLRVTVPGAGVTVYHLYKKITSIGSAAENDVVLPDPLIAESFAHIHFDGRDYNFATIEQCRSACPAGLCSADFNDDGAVDAADLAQLLVTWGPCGGCPADFNADGNIDGSDLADLLAAWGPCS